VATRRNPGEGGLHWEESRQRWLATVYLGYSPEGKRRKVKVSARTKTEAKAKLQQLLRDRDDGHVLGGQTYTVRDAVESWLAHGLTGGQESTVVNRTILARTHVIPALGARKLAQLSAEEVDEWLDDAANVRRAFRQVAEDAGLRAEDWTPRERRHSAAAPWSVFSCRRQPLPCHGGLTRSGEGPQAVIESTRVHALHHSCKPEAPILPLNSNHQGEIDAAILGS
jgi:hypothetical protein